MPIRQAKQSDIPAIVELAIKSVSRDPLPLVADPDRMASMAASLIGNPAHFVWVGETDGKVTSCVGAQVGPGFWFRGLQASVLLYFADTPSHGGMLILKFARWCKSRSGIKLAVLECEPDTDPRLERLIRRLGFGRKSNNWTYVRPK